MYGEIWQINFNKKDKRFAGIERGEIIMNEKRKYKKYKAHGKEIIPCLCSWFDLLGYGKPFVDSKWNLSDEKCYNNFQRSRFLMSLQADGQPIQWVLGYLLMTVMHVRLT